jgi:hypothetical protein
VNCGNEYLVKLFIEISKACFFGLEFRTGRGLVIEVLHVKMQIIRKKVYRTHRDPYYCYRVTQHYYGSI